MIVRFVAGGADSLKFAFMTGSKWPATFPLILLGLRHESGKSFYAVSPSQRKVRVTITTAKQVLKQE